jgi:predicted transcriptional regulator
LLSIHPRHAEAILRGDKKVELRRAPVALETTHVLIYATSPVQAVVGWFQVGGVDEDSATGIWNLHGPVTGVTRREHRAYFAGATRAYAIRVELARRLDPPLSLEDIPGVRRPPQSFLYVDRETILWVFAANDRLLVGSTP